MTDTHKTDFLGRDPIFPLLLKMGIPSVIGMLVNALYNIVDTIFVGHGVGPTAIASLSIVFPIQMIVSSFANALGFGTASIVSRRLGERKQEEAAQAMGTAYVSVAAVSAVMVAVVFLFMRPLLSFFGASATIMPYAVEYLRIVAVGFFFFSMSMCASNLVRAEGNARASMFGMLIGAVLNTILDPIFIFALKTGVAGAAIATVISQAASCVYLFGIYFRGKAHVPLKLKHLRIRWDLFVQSFVLGIPSFVQNAGMSLLALLINTTLGRYGGDEAITMYGMNHKINMIVIMPVLGIVQGFQPIAGYNFGARQFRRVRESLRTAILTAVCLACAGYAFMMLAPRTAMRLFTSDPALIVKSARALRIMVLFVPAAAVQITSSTYFQAIGRPTQAFVLGVSRQFLMLIPFVLVLPRFFGVDGVWAAFPIADLVSTVLSAILLAFSVRRLESYAKGHPASVPQAEVV